MIKKQDVLTDVSPSGKQKPWKEKRMANILLSQAYQDLNPNKMIRLQNCASFLEFRILEDNSKKLINANFCRVGLCPMCNWRRSLKIFSNTNQIMTAMEKQREYGYIFVTFTVRNCEGNNLSQTIDEMMQAWKKLTKYVPFKKAVHGYYRGLEITHNTKKESESYDTYHPHFHCILVVNKSYFKDNEIYITQKKWVSLWQKAMKLDYQPNVDVRRVKGNTAKAVSEVAKYSVKDADYIIKHDWDLTLCSVKILDKALHKRRLVAYGGIMKKLHKQLNLDDELNGDLINIKQDDDELRKEGKIITFAWNVGYNNYVRV